MPVTLTNNYQFNNFVHFLRVGHVYSLVISPYQQKGLLFCLGNDSSTSVFDSMILKLGLSALFMILLIWMQACAEFKPLTLPVTMQPADCERFFREMDSQVDEYDVADAGTARIQGFPMLRVDRFLASFAKDKLSEEALATWLERMRKLDETARLIEWRNLPSEAKLPVNTFVAADVERATMACGHLLAAQVLQSPSLLNRLLSAVEVPDAYSAWQRTLGLYFLTRWAVSDGVRQLHQEIRAPFIQAYNAQPVKGRLIRYTPPSTRITQTAEMADILENSKANPLGIPEPSKAQLEQLFNAYAPIWLVDTVTDSDRIGTVRINDDQQAYIDTQNPRVYRAPSYTRYGNQILLQLNYHIWFPARPPTNPLDIYAGRFDGLIWRVTLNMDGKPLAYDSIHPCGCYYQIFPGEGVKVVQPEDGSEPVLTPTPILAVLSNKRLAVRITSGNHFISGINLEPISQDVEQYGWLDYNPLRSLPIPNSQYRSLFGSDGLVQASERLERFLLWPLGVPSAGSMRQWGTHAIAFLGKRHFDDPRLMEKLVRPLWE